MTAESGGTFDDGGLSHNGYLRGEINQSAFMTAADARRSALPVS